MWAERYDRPLDDIFVLQDEITLSVVGAIEPSLRRAEVERIIRMRPESLDAYDLVLQAQPDVSVGDAGARDKSAAATGTRTRARSHLRAGACVCRDVPSWPVPARRTARRKSGGLDPPCSDRDRYGQDDALALTFAGFSIGMDGHDRAAAFAAFEAALAVSPSSALTYILAASFSP